ncbi:MAG: hypothetical protein BWY77_00758 [bacterium ADurb.Bin431]|nr:MAG: hypothetical protein BWY77_00758 [bacterium ADurb.Bin431]
MNGASSTSMPAASMISISPPVTAAHRTGSGRWIFSAAPPPAAWPKFWGLNWSRSISLHAPSASAALAAGCCRRSPPPQPPTCAPIAPASIPISPPPGSCRSNSALSAILLNPGSRRRAWPACASSAGCSAWAGISIWSTPKPLRKWTHKSSSASSRRPCRGCALSRSGWMRATRPRQRLSNAVRAWTASCAACCRCHPLILCGGLHSSRRENGIPAAVSR